LLFRYEGRAAEVAMRSALALGQGLSIAVASFASKLMLMAHGTRRSLLSDHAARWVRHGYLVYFQGLISTAGKEKGMMQV